jgi:large subunit ribosomal protein L25
LRRQGLVPGVVYARGEEARPFQVSERDARAVLSEGHALFDIEIEGSGAVPVVVKEQQRHPVRGELQHLDLHEVKLDEAIQAEVPIELEGPEDAPGTKEGGVLEHITREVSVEALPTDIPDRIAVDVSQMNINDTIQLAAIKPPQGVTFIAEDLEEVTIATVTPPRLERELEEIEEEAALVGEEGEEVPEGEEIAEAAAPEGEEAPAEGEAEPGGGESGEES